MRTKVIYQELKELAQILAQLNADQILVLVDENTEKHCLPILLEATPVLKGALHFVIPSGEQNKTMQHCENVWQFMSEKLLSRKSVIINLGGGMLCDMGGLIAGLYKRGIAFINIPTTLLAMADAAIGGKVAVDFMSFKNQIGLFNEAHRQILHPTFLETLPQEELLNAYAEMLKHALIADAKHWHALISIGPNELTQSQLENSIAIKATIVERDPKEKGVRKLLNFGHTVGHAIESFYLNSEKPLKHGHAVAIGMLIEAHISMQHKMLDLGLFKDISKVLIKYYSLPADLHFHVDKLYDLMQQDKKNENQEVRCVLLKGIGSADYDQNVTKSALTLALKEVNT